MKTLKFAFLLVAIIGSSFIATGAEAHGRRHHHHHHRGHIGIWFGVPAPFFYYPRYYYPRYYYPAPVVVPAPVSSPVYIEQSTSDAAPPSAPAQSSGAYWYYCRDAQTYYPYVQQCASPWERVVPHSAPPS
jgi:hypothetical protein